MPNQYDPPGQADRNWEIWDLYAQGFSQREIARRFNLTQGRVSGIIKDIRSQLPEETKQDWRKRELTFLDTMRKDMMELVKKPLPPATNSKGELLRDEDGEIIRDATGRLAAYDRALNTHAKLVQMLGLAEMAKEPTGGSDPTQAAQEAAADAAQYLNEE